VTKAPLTSAANTAACSGRRRVRMSSSYAGKRGARCRRDQAFPAPAFPGVEIAYKFCHGQRSMTLVIHGGSTMHRIWIWPGRCHLWHPVEVFGPESYTTSGSSILYADGTITTEITRPLLPRVATAALLTGIELIRLTRSGPSPHQ